MPRRKENITRSKPILSAQTLIVSGIAWAIVALLFFLLFSSVMEPATVASEAPARPLWYSIGTYIFVWVANLAASILCLRNWGSPQIVSGRSVWLALGVGMLFYFIGDVLFFTWEIVWKLEPDVSLGDVCYLLSYICLGWGMILAVLSKRVNLEKWQWGVLGGIAAAGIALAVWLYIAPGAADVGTVEGVVEEAASTVSSAPEWIQTIDQQLSEFSDLIGLFYAVADVLLLIIASALLLAFWGGRFSQSWQMIAAATFSLYIADMWFKYADSYLENYQSGFLLEVFWVFSPILFGIGAVLEHRISTRNRSRQGRRRRGGASA
ncbi:MAG: hypothetical protein F6J93_17215 [Oscillatoria sp. SIO1A7]|nr:hypothetical protein [Oscillatoria sp. SIO1A7]